MLLVVPFLYVTIYFEILWKSLRNFEKIKPLCQYASVGFERKLNLLVKNTKQPQETKIKVLKAATSTSLVDCDTSVSSRAEIT